MTRLALALAALATLALPRPASAVGALEVGPAEPLFVVATPRAGAFDEQADRLRAYLASVGLEDPGIERLRALLREELRLKAGPVLPAMGIDPAGAAAFYVVRVPDTAPQPVLAVEISDRKAFERFLVLVAEKDQWVEEGQKPKKARVERQKLPGGAVELRVRLGDSPPNVARIKDRVAILSDRAEALDAMRLGGGAMPPLMQALKPADGEVAVAMWASPQAMGDTGREAPAWLTVLEQLQGWAIMGPSGARMEATGRFTADVEPFVNLARPSADGAEARAVMAGLAGRDTQGWARWSFDSKAMWGLAETMLGDAINDVKAEFRKELGIDLQKDLVDVVTGDVMLACREGIASCVLVGGVRDPGAAERTVLNLLKAGEKDGRLAFATTRQALPDGRMLSRTRVTEQAMRWGDDGPQPTGEREPLVDLHWGTRPHALVVGFTPWAVRDALTRSEPPATGLPAPLADGPFGEGVALATYQATLEPSTLLRQALPMVRGLLPAETTAGTVGRVLDAVMALTDRVVDGGAALRIDGMSWTLASESRALPVPGAPGYDAALDAAYSDAMRLRYQGNVRGSNKALLALTGRAGDSALGRKAEAYVVAGDDLSTFVAAGFMSGFMTAMRAFAEGVDRERYEAGAAPAPAPGQCAALEQLTCSGPQPSPGSCRIARRGIEADCEREFQALLNAP